MILDLVLFAIGLAGLYLGAEWLVGGSVRLAAAMGISSFVVGLTLVSMGTSAPELVVSGLASWQGNGGLSLGNVLGSNVANIALILGISALMVVIRTHDDLLRRDLPIMIGTAGLVLLFGFSGEISRVEGLVLLAVFASYIFVLARSARSSDAVHSPLDEMEEAQEKTPSLRRDIGLTVVGLVVLSVGARLLVDSAINIAGVLGVPDVVIGLTMVAFGTSLPELAASISAARRSEGDLVLGNIVGSNIFNVTLILGVASLINPLPVSRGVMSFDAPIVFAFSVLLVPIVMTRMRVDRWEGGLLVAAYAAFVMIAVF